MAYTKTQQTAYTAAMEYLDEGLLPACIPVHDGEDWGVYTTVASLRNRDWRPKTEEDAMAAAIITIFRAHREAERSGLHPVDS